MVEVRPAVVHNELSRLDLLLSTAIQLHLAGNPQRTLRRKRLTSLCVLFWSHGMKDLSALQHLAMGEMCCVKDVGFVCTMLVLFDLVEQRKLEKRQSIRCEYVIVSDINPSYE